MAIQHSNSQGTDCQQPRTKNNEDSKWTSPRECYTNSEKEKILSVYIAHLVRICMEYHTYWIGGDVKQQETDGPACLWMTGSISKNTMNKWRRKTHSLQWSRTACDFAFKIYRWLHQSRRENKARNSMGQRQQYTNSGYSTERRHPEQNFTRESSSKGMKLTGILHHERHQVYH